VSSGAGCGVEKDAAPAAEQLPDLLEKSPGLTAERHRHKKI
jgi:hypothetical protein